MGKKIQGKKHKCKDCGKILPADAFENDPDICWKCWEHYQLCSKCNEYHRRENLINIGQGEYACKECAEACGLEEEEDD